MDTVRIFLIEGAEMKEQCIKEAEHLFKQWRKEKKIPTDATLKKRNSACPTFRKMEGTIEFFPLS